MKRRRNRSQPPGQDSFLDVVANLVGILIILVVIVGAHAGATLQRAARTAADPETIESLQQQLSSTSATAARLERDNLLLESAIQTEHTLAEARQIERDQLLVQLVQYERETAERASQLSDHEARQIQRRQIVEELQTKLQDIQLQTETLENATARIETIDHYPTPIARTVFSDEVHFRLSGGKIVYVPLNELVDLMRSEWRVKARKLESATSTIETVGPVQQFRLQYQLVSAEVKTPTSFGSLVRQTTQFKRFELVPVRENLGVPVEQAVATDSTFQQRIDRLDPHSTTISVWVYPDSYSQFNRLKKWLYDRGFETAVWPLPFGKRISGGPNGMRSTAQ